MDDLDLKLVVHIGEMVKQTIGGREELAGRDVILVHRLLKNSVGQRFGAQAYALYTDATIAAIAGAQATRGLAAHEEPIAIIGPAMAWYRDLEAAWRIDDARRSQIV